MYLFAGMGQQPNNSGMNQNMGQNQGPGGLQQQTPALVAQLQRQLPNQQNPNNNMMGQQQQQQHFNQPPF